ncbi:macro domain-containing protein [Cryobacterium sp. TMT1-21]|uniref:macro domain-containing protein n=1 Tax=Cryobacterium sp. TMT1-21 TaxID=1259234 RepID=UPI001F5440C6|nr:macro domain-containing protein [Cryobacterium sp. TMT1-21]
MKGEAHHEYVNGVRIRLVVGDLFEQGASAVVGFTTTFDTSVPSIISPTSVQAALLGKIYGGSQERLDADLAAALTRLEPTGRSLPKVGNTVCYPLGSAATLTLPDGRHMYCAAYTEMNEHNNASGTIRSVLDGLDSTWDEANRVGNGAPICVPLIGQGQSRIPELTAEVAIRLIAFSFLLRSQKGRFASELRIVVHPSDKHRVNFSEFQAFLRSLAS